MSGAVVPVAPVGLRDAANYLFPVEGQNEIIVPPAGSTGGQINLSNLISWANSQSTSANPYTIRLLPGVFNVTSTIIGTGASYVNIIGAGRDKTILLKSTTAANTITTGRGSDPVLALDSTTGCRLAALTLKHTGSWASGQQPEGLNLNSATAFQSTAVRVESTYIGVESLQSSFPSTNDEANEIQFRDSILVVNHDGLDPSADTLYLTKADVKLLNCTTIMKSAVGGPDVMALLSGSRLVMVGGEHIRRVTGSISTATAGRVILMTIAQGFTTKCYCVGARLYLDATSGDWNSATADVTAIDISASTGITTGDCDVSFTDCKIDRESGTLTQARSFVGLQIGTFGTAGTLGTLRLNGTEFRDLGGSGATNRQDVMVIVASSGGVKQPKAIYNNGSRIGSWGYRSTLGTPAVTHTSMVVTEPTANYQTGTVTFATAATAPVTLPVAYPTMSTDVADYNIAIEPSIGETFWVTSKTKTGFTLNSSNASSTATVRWSLER